MLEKLKDIMLELVENLNEITFEKDSKIIDMVNGLQPVVTYLLQSEQLNIEVKESDILEMLQDTLIGIEQEDAVLLQDVLKYGWLPLIKELENIIEDKGEKYE